MAPGIIVGDIVAVRGPLFGGLDQMTLPGKCTAAVVVGDTDMLCDFNLDAPGGTVAVTGVYFDITLALIAGQFPACIQYTEEDEDDDYGVISASRKAAAIVNLDEGG